jgi:dCTP deaminase
MGALPGYFNRLRLIRRVAQEVRSRDVLFLLEDGQPVGRLVFEQLADAADELYGAGKTSNYQHQGLKLSKHFRT